MKRVITIDDLTIDLGNIKNIRLDTYSSSSGGSYVLIELLKGKEYVFNPETEETNLMEPIIKTYFGSINAGSSFIKDLEKDWNNYLISTEK